MGMRLIEGRDIDWADLSDNRNVVIVNETVARKLWPGQDPIGRIALGGRHGGARDRRDCRCSRNQRRRRCRLADVPAGHEAVRTGGLLSGGAVETAPGHAGSQRERRLRQINPGQPATEFKPIQNLVDHATSPRRFFFLLVSIFAGLGLLLATLGIYGVISYSVTRETQQIGIRMALGATRERVLFGVIWKTLRLAFIGIGAGMRLVGSCTAHSVSFVRHRSE